MLRNDLDCIPLLKELEKIRIKHFTAMAITSYIDQARMARILRAGFTNILFKPFDRNLFIDALKKQQLMRDTFDAVPASFDFKK